MKFLLLALAVSLQAEDLSSILTKMVEAQNKNWEKASQYTYVEYVEHFGFDKNKQPRKESSETFEVMFLEGESYRKLIARNDAPLAEKDRAKEEQKMRQIAEERRKQRRSGLFRKTVRLGSDGDILTLFTCRLAGEEKVGARNAWVLDCPPNKAHTPANKGEKEAMGFQRKLWVDQADYQSLRTVFTVVESYLTFQPGTTIEWGYTKLDAVVWVRETGLIDGRLQFARLIKPQVRTKYQFRDYRKFDVQSTITVEPPQ